MTRLGVAILVLLGLAACDDEGVPPDAGAADAGGDAADEQPPTIGFVSPAADAPVAGVVVVELEASDDVGIAEVTLDLEGVPLAALAAAPWTAAWDTTALLDGRYTLHAIATDGAGRSAEASRRVLVRNPGLPGDDKPTVELTAPAAGARVCGTILVEAAASDDQGIARVDFYAAGVPLGTVTSPPWRRPWDTAAAGAGPQVVSAIAADLAGQVAQDHLTVEVDPSGDCDAPPAVTLTAPEDGALVRGPVPLRAEADDDVAVARVRFLVDGGEVAVVAAPPWEAVLDSDALAEGAHVVAAEAEDGAAQTGADAVAITVDRTPPALAILYPGDGATIAGDFSVLVAADDAHGVARVTLAVDGAPVTEWSAPPYLWAFRLDEQGCGPHTVAATAEDTGGLTATAAAGFVAADPCDADCDGHPALACGGGDCDDGAALVHPGAADPAGDGLDQSCDGVDGLDADGDLVPAVASGGTDCDDGDPAIHGAWVAATREIVDAPGDVGTYASIARDAAGGVHLAYYDYGAGDLKYAAGGPGAWSVEVVDGAGADVGGWTSIAVDAAGAAHIAYYDFGAGDLRYATNGSGAWAVTVVDAAGDTGYTPSLALDGAGRAHVAYFDDAAGALRYATNAGGAWATQTVDSAGNTGWQPSLELDGAGAAHVSYYDLDALDLRYATNAGGSWVKQTVDAAGDVGVMSSLALGADGAPRIAYYDNTGWNLKLAAEGAGGAWTTQVLDAAGDVGAWPSLAVDAAGVARLAYYDWDRGDLVYASDAGGSWRKATAADTGDVGSWAALAPAPGGAVVATYEALARDLHVVWLGAGPIAPADDVLGDGVDQSCDGVDGVDADGDGFAAAAAGGDDCDDADPAVTAWITELVDDDGNVGEHASLALDAAGAAHVAYYAVGTGDLRYATDASGAWVIQAVDSTGDVGRYAALVLDGAGKAHVAYYDATNRDLVVASNASGAWARQVADAAGDVGAYASIAVDAAGKRHVAYYDGSNGDLKLATDASGSWAAVTVDGAGDVGRFTSLALVGGARHVSYWDGSAGDLRHATDASGGWVSETVAAAGDVGRYASLALDATGAATIACYDATGGDLVVAAGAPGAWSVTVVDDGVDVGAWASLARSASGTAWISYYDAAAGDLKLATDGSGAWIARTIDRAGNVGSHGSIAVGDARPTIAYRDVTRLALKLARPCD